MSVQRCLNGLNSKLAVVLGAQWGDEGKGKLVSVLSDHYDVSARFNGGANAGHTVIRNGKKYAFHLVPSAIVSPKIQTLLGNGVVVNLDGMFQQLSQLDKNNLSYANRMFVSDRAHLVTKYQIEEDGANEKRFFLGTTKKGIGPTYAAKIHRFGLRVGDLLHWDTFQAKYKRMSEFYNQEKKTTQLAQFQRYRDILLEKNMIVQSVGWINEKMKSGKTVLAQGANAALLDIDLGTYPYVTSSSTSVGGVCTGLGIAPNKIETVIGVAKAYTTRVGEGPFPTELNDAHGKQMQERGHEFGTTTGRPRRCGWLDLPLLRYTNMINGYSSWNLTKLDILDSFKEIKVAVAYKLNGRQLDSLPGSLEDLAKVEVVYEKLKGWEKDITKCVKAEQLPKEAIDYIRFMERHTGVKVSWVGTGPSDEAMVQLI